MASTARPWCITSGCMKSPTHRKRPVAGPAAADLLRRNAQLFAPRRRPDADGRARSGDLRGELLFEDPIENLRRAAGLLLLSWTACGRGSCPVFCEAFPGLCEAGDTAPASPSRATASIDGAGCGPRRVPAYRWAAGVPAGSPVEIPPRFPSGISPNRRGLKSEHQKTALSLLATTHNLSSARVGKDQNFRRSRIPHQNSAFVAKRGKNFSETAGPIRRSDEAVAAAEQALTLRTADFSRARRGVDEAVAGVVRMFPLDQLAAVAAAAHCEPNQRACTRGCCDEGPEFVAGLLSIEDGQTLRANRPAIRTPVVFQVAAGQCVRHRPACLYESTKVGVIGKDVA